ncbi:MAG: YcaO-like family protein [Deltaproteobacteria bacterium]|nr:YcaO-like family protein [Deltaproteobacteria bacterium]
MARVFFDSPAPKVYSRGTTRTRSPRETLARLEPVLGHFGITRLANVTGLDHLDIPVYQAVRPNARSLAVSQGKGLDAVSAKVSALMESLEAHHAEHTRCSVRLESYRALSRRNLVADPEFLPLSRTSRFHPEASLPWAAARDVVTHERVYVPFELVHANYTLPRVPGSGAFAPGTSGLGSGNHLAEATLHGTCELIERDAEALWKLSGGESLTATRIDPSSVDHPAPRELVDRMRRAGSEVMIWDMTSDVGIATFGVFVFDLEADPDLNPCPAANGSGTHPDRSIALCRALTEAAQSRLTSIAGSRDDLTIARYHWFQSARSLEHYRALTRAPTGRSYSDVPDFIGASIDEDLGHVIGRLAARGMRRVLAVDHSGREFGWGQDAESSEVHEPEPLSDFAFVRMVIPGLEGSSESPSYRPGARGRARLA